MNSKMHRRSFIKRSVLAAGAASTVRYLGFPSILSAREAGDVLNCAQIGCGIRSETHLDQVIRSQRQNLVAMVDPDDRQIASKRRRLQGYGINTDKVQLFSDYRVMFDKMGGQIDAVFIATPNHNHAPAAMRAMEAGINVYCEKPMTNSIADARKLSQASLQVQESRHADGQPGALRRRVSPAVRVYLGRSHRQRDRNP